MMKTKAKRTRMLSFRANEEEIARIKEFAKGLIEKYPYMKEADVLRELVGLVDTGVITPEMRRGLREGVASDDQIERKEKVIDFQEVTQNR
jgi:hypothetical protein